MQLKDIAVLITGGGSGLGAATARAMAARGARVAVLDQSKENAEKVAAELKGIAVVADVTDEEQVKAAIAKAEAAHGIARVLMNCAGIGGSQRIVGKDGVYPLAKFARIINVNLIGTFNVLRLFSERLLTEAPIGEGVPLVDGRALAPLPCLDEGGLARVDAQRATSRSCSAGPGPSPAGWSGAGRS